MLLIYSCLFTIAIIVASPYFAFKMLKEKKYYQGLSQRFGMLAQQSMDKKSIWIHTVSVGEFLTSLPIIDRLNKEYPNYSIVVTTTTNTAYSIATKQIKHKAVLLFSPLDLGFIIQRFIKYINPAILIIMETELWPNLINQTSKNKIPIMILNGRISDKSYPRYRIIRIFYKKILACIKSICVQTKQDYERFLAIGAKKQQITIAGNIKFDIKPSGAIQRQELFPGISKDHKIWLAGSTHEKEEEIVLNVFKEILSKYPGLRLILAPRHPERIPKVAFCAV